MPLEFPCGGRGRVRRPLDPVIQATYAPGSWVLVLHADFAESCLHRVATAIQAFQGVPASVSVLSDVFDRSVGGGASETLQTLEDVRPLGVAAEALALDVHEHAQCLPEDVRVQVCELAVLPVVVLVDRLVFRSIPRSSVEHRSGCVLFGHRTSLGHLNRRDSPIYRLH